MQKLEPKQLNCRCDAMCLAQREEGLRLVCPECDVELIRVEYELGFRHEHPKGEA